MTSGIPPQGFRHAVALLLKNKVGRPGVDTEQLARDLLALGDDMRVPADYAGWVIQEFERVLHLPAPGMLAAFGHRAPSPLEARDIFLIYVPEDRLPLAAPLAVELTKRGITVAFSEYEVESEEQLASSLSRGLLHHQAGAVLVTTAFHRRNLNPPDAQPRLMVLDQTILPSPSAEKVARWLSAFHTKDPDLEART